MALKGYNVHTHVNVTVSECKAVCERNDQCLSVDYYKAESQCVLNSVTQLDVPLTQSEKYDHHEIHCISGKQWNI